MGNSVCYKCSSRAVGCHSDCPKYAKEKAEREKERENRQKLVELYSSRVYGSTIRRINLARKNWR